MFHATDRNFLSRRPWLAALLTSTALVAAGPALAQSLPTGGQVAAGSATIGDAANGALTVTQTSANAVVNWQSFNIGEGNSVTFVQPDAASAILNRVTGATTTTIAGSLIANGQVYLVNPNGIAITATGTIDTGAFVASTLDISDSDFMAGNLTFTGDGASQAVTNAGTITIARGGYLALIGGTVANSGTITVPMGKVALGSGEQATLDLAGDGFLQVAIPTAAAGDGALVSNSGIIAANGGLVQLTAAAARDMARQAVNMSGTIEAKGVAGTSGAIILSGSDGAVAVSGTLDASNAAGTGGNVTVTGRELALTAARVDASGTTGGGTIHIGGDWQGGGTLQRAETLSVDASSVIAADATVSGDGGEVVLWSDNHTSFAGTITARGGSVSGDGGEVEVSGKALLSYTGFTDLTAANGDFGDLLLDPYNVTISSGTGIAGFTATANDSVINATTLTNALGSANVTVSTGSSGAQAGTITVAAALNWTAATTLTLNAASNIAINAAITATNGGLTLTSGGTITDTAALYIGGTFNLTAGSWVQNAATLADFYAYDFQLNGGSFLRVTGGTGASGNAYNIADVYGLQGIGSSAAYLSAHWTLTGDIDASGTANWYSGAGFNPIGTSSTKFTGTFDGDGHTITGLTIDRSSTNYVGLFGYAGSGATIENVGLVGGSVSGNNDVGGLVGINAGTITNAYATGAVSGRWYVGGLVGSNTGTISNAYATGAVGGYGQAGGLVGRNEGTISNAYATGAVSGTDEVGGLVGISSSGTITNAYATGDVSGSHRVGGLVGYNRATLSNAYATGAVSGTSDVGGLVGYNFNGTITDSFWDTQTTGQAGDCGVNNGGTCSATGLTTAQARSASSYTGWDFTSVWYQSGGMRPILRSEAATADANGVITINNLHQLALIGANLSANYALIADIDASETEGANASGIWSTSGWVPVGTSSTNFTGTFDGDGHTITGLTIDRSSTDYVGLFGYTGSGATIENVGLVGGSVSGNFYVGGLVGLNLGTITNAYVTGAVSGATHVGGLVGYNHLRAITNAYATGAVSGSGYVGGLVGSNYYGTITNAYATGAVSGVYAAGGLVGYNYYGTISNAYATGAVSGSNYVGGLIGMNYDSTVSDVYATGAVSGNYYVGGLVGGNYSTIRNAYATGAVSGSAYFGGLVGYNDRGTITNSFWDTETTGRSGACGYNSGTCSATGLTTSQMSDPFQYIDAAWDFSSTWATLQTGGSPVLRSLTSDPVYDYYIRVSGDTSTIYGDTIDTSGISLDGLGTDNVTVNWGSAITADTDVGTYAYADSNILSLTYSTGSATDYYVDYGTGALTISQRALTIVANALSRTYGDANPTLTYTETGLVNGDTLSGSLATTAGQYSDVGAYAITQGSLAASSNYALTYTGANLTVSQRALAVVADALFKTYGDANPTLTYTATGLVNSDTLSGALATTAGQYSDVGTYAITLGSLANANYGISYTGANLTVNQRALAVVADALSKTYGDANPALTYTATGLVNNDALTGALATTAGQYSDVGSYAITQGTLGNANYAISYTGADLTVNQRALSVVADALSKTYGDANPALTYTATGLVNNDALTGALATTAGQYSDVGAYAITQGSLANSNYAISYTGANLTVNQRALAVVADALSKTYGDANPTLTYTATGLVNGDTLTGALATTAGQYSDVGSYAITQGSLGNANYAIAYTGANLTVSQRALAVVADALSKTYGDANPTLTYTATGLVNSDTLTGALATAAGQYSDVGSYAITQGSLGNVNYAIAYTGANLTVNQRALSVVADALSKTYGDVNPTLTYTATGLVNSDTLSGSLATTAGQYSDVGSYAITQGSLGNANYAIAYTGANLTVNQRALSVVADALSKTYGDANPTLTYTATGLVNSDTLTGSLATAAGQYSDVGAYAITLGNLANSNYAISYTGANLTVSQRALTVAADSLSRAYGLANPALTYTVAEGGLVNGDTLSGSLTTLATSLSAPGDYVITQGTLEASANYSLHYIPGVLTVEMVTKPVPGTMAGSVAAAFDRGWLIPLLPLSSDEAQSSDGSPILIADPRFAGTLICFDNKERCVWLPPSPGL